MLVISGQQWRVITRLRCDCPVHGRRAVTAGARGQVMKRFDMGLSLAVCLAAMIWGTVANADYEAIGIGNLSCGKFIASIGKRPPGGITTMSTRNGELVSENAQYVQWLMGFVSGFNAVMAHIGEEQQQVRRVDGAGIDLWMRNWCNKHPTQPFVEAGALFINEMLTNAAAPPPGGTGDGYSQPARDSLKKLIEKPAAK
jgi:hypothetical protein